MTKYHNIYKVTERLFTAEDNHLCGWKQLQFIPGKCHSIWEIAVTRISSTKIHACEMPSFLHKGSNILMECINFFIKNIKLNTPPSYLIIVEVSALTDTACKQIKWKWPRKNSVPPEIRHNKISEMLWGLMLLFSNSEDNGICEISFNKHFCLHKCIPFGL